VGMSSQKKEKCI